MAGLAHRGSEYIRIGGCNEFHEGGCSVLKRQIAVLGLLAYYRRGPGPGSEDDEEASVFWASGFRPRTTYFYRLDRGTSKLNMRVLITGVAGFLGSHLADALLAEGNAIVGVDNLSTGSLENLKHLKNEGRFEFREHDICTPFDVGPVDYVFNFASPASPVDYARLGVETLKVGSRGHDQRPRYRQEVQAQSFCMHRLRSAMGTRMCIRRRRTTGGM